jgi:hypothetical protein
MGAPVNHKRIRPRYNPTPTAAEKAHHLRLMDMPCICCGREGGVFHHLLSRNPFGRWRRDHELGLPMSDYCHRSLHADGDEWAYCMARGFEPVAEALRLRDESRTLGILSE